MNFYTPFNYRYLSRFFACLLLVSTACTKEIKREIVVYQNDFETGDLSSISNGTIDVFNNTQVLGKFNKGGFGLKMDGLPEHNYIQLSFDLYIHDSWDGNEIGVDGPDFWKVTIDGKPYLNTTFANRPCGGYDCPPQSYPAEYPFNNYSRFTAEPGELKGACVLGNEPLGSSRYKFTRLIKHDQASFTLECRDELKQTSAPDYFQACDESWSIDNMVIKAVTLR